MGAQMAAKGMLEWFHSYLGDDKPGFRRERRDSVNLFEQIPSLTSVEGIRCSL